MGKMLSDFQSQVDEYMKFVLMFDGDIQKQIVYNIDRGIWGEIK
jgi:hypothetical protein